MAMQDVSIRGGWLRDVWKLLFLQLSGGLKLVQNKKLKNFQCQRWEGTTRETMTGLRLRKSRH